MKKAGLNKYWILIAFITIANIMIFSFMSKHLEGFVSDNIAESATENIYTN
ncbi:MAG: hypothetical protein WCK91_01690 [bacterium]